MERIQSAIEKARATRNGAPARSAPRSPNPPPRQHGIRDAWAGLREWAPSARVMANNRIVTFAGGADATPFDLLRTRILQQMRANNWRRLAITSPGSDCGKTTICANLAFSLARQGDIQSVVIELDMRRPALGRALGLEAEPMQLSQALDGTDDIAQHMVRYGDNLAFGFSRAAIRNSSELLQSAKLADVLADYEARFAPTITIFDMPPMQASDDMLGFAGKVDCVLLLAAAERSSIEEIDTCERDLAEQTNVLGIVLNKCRYPEQSYGYYA